MSDFVEAIKRSDEIKPLACRAWGENFSLEKVGDMYDKYFTDVYNVYEGKGWYEHNAYGINSMTKRYPNIV